MRGLGAGLAWALACLSTPQDPAPVFTRFDLARERIGHKVTADVTLANTLEADLADVRVTVVYFDGDREVKRSKPVSIARIGRGQSGSCRIETEQVQNFSRYEVVLEYGGKQRAYIGNDPARPPVLKKAGPAKLAVVYQKDAPPKNHPGDAAVVIVLKNAGESEGQEPVVTLTFLDANAAVVHKLRVRLPEPVGSGSEDTFEITVPRVPSYASVQATVAWLAAVGPSLPEPEGEGKEVELRRCRIIRLNDGSARVSGAVWNGLAKPVEKVVVKFRLGKIEAPHAIPGALRPGEARGFECYVADCPPFEACGFGLSYVDTPPGAPVVPVPEPTARRTESRPAEPKPVARPPEAKPQEKEPADKGAVKVELRGLLTVEGTSRRLGDKVHYTGDVFLLRLAFTDEKGVPLQATPTINMVLYNGQEPYKKVQRIVTKEQWKADASRINQQTVADNTIACDKKTGDLWVAFVRTDGPGFDPRADITLTIRDAGTWTWKGIDRKFESPARGPDKK